ncbi:MAG: hypothetical protein EXR49_02805 [Dehalococcoidia bacterium]|nr:hypothetical protein [Dehalococcoidia bacterium]
MLRPSNPADLPSLLLLHARALPNQACGGAALGKNRPPSSPLLPALSSWLIRSPGRATWISTRAALAAGLITVEQRRGPTCWDVTWLSTRHADTAICTDMLEAASQRIARRGAQRLLLLLHDDSPLEHAVRLAGFIPYVSHTLLHRRPGPLPLHLPPPASGPAISPATPETEFGAFRLFQRLAPIVAREAEGLTLSDWNDSHERMPRRERTFICDRDGAVVASARLALHRSCATIDCLFDPRSQEDAAALLSAVTTAHHTRTLACLAPSYLPALVPLLERSGFQRAGAYTGFARHLTVRIKEPGLVPVGA